MAVKLSTPSTNNSVKTPRSRYVQGGDTDQFAKRLGWWERRPIPQDDSDIITTIRAEEASRPDLIAYNVYGYSNLAWVVLQFNNIVDTETELLMGMELRLPTPRRLMLDVLTRSPK